VRVGVDVGGTFTDICLLAELTGTLTVVKVLSTPDDPAHGLVAGVQGALRATGTEPGAVREFVHGTTVALNALIQGQGARTGLITTRGFRDVLELRRQRRPDLYDLQVDLVPPLIPRNLRYEVEERATSDGSILRPLGADQVAKAIEALKVAGVESVAVCFLYAHLVPDHERAVLALLTQEFPAAFATASHEVAPEFREYERWSTTAVNAFLGPLMARYVDSLQVGLANLGIQAPIRISQSNGGAMSLATARRLPVRTVLSGPSAGVVGAIDVASAAGRADVITFDMGGTSTDVSLVRDATPSIVSEQEIHGHAVRIPMVDIHTIGAGGGSIAWVDAGGLLKVGPHSAGADPGPACFGRGGLEATITDAHVVLGTLPQDALLGGRLLIDAGAARKVLGRLARHLGEEVPAVAAGIVAVAVANIVRAIRVISVRRGHDPRQYTLVAYGGAGPLHAGWIAAELGIPRVLIPEHPGLLAAFGHLVSDHRADFSLTRIADLDRVTVDEVAALFGGLEQAGTDWLTEEEIPSRCQTLLRTVDARYVGQSYELSVPVPNHLKETDSLARLATAFHELHDQHFGHIAPQEPVQLVTYRVAAIGRRTPIKRQAVARSVGPADARGERVAYLAPDRSCAIACPVFARETLGPGQVLVGPALVDQMDSTTVILPGHVATVDGRGNLIMTREGS
jgi:N-methylhydantoinase A